MGERVEHFGSHNINAAFLSPILLKIQYVTHTGFHEFRTNFYELIRRGGIGDNLILKEELFKNLPQEFQSNLFYFHCYTCDFRVLSYPWTVSNL